MAPIAERDGHHLADAGLGALALATTGVVAWLLLRNLNEPADGSGAAIPLKRERGSIGASPDARVVDGPADPDWVRDLARWVPAPPRTRLGRLLAVLWALPSTLPGLIVGLLTLRRPVLRDGVLVFPRARGVPGLLLRRGGFAATTLGHVVIARAEPSPVLLAHELVHTRHAERLGPLNGPVYWALLLRYGYVRHPLERAARRVGRDARSAAA